MHKPAYSPSPPLVSSPPPRLLPIHMSHSPASVHSTSHIPPPTHDQLHKLSNTSSNTSRTISRKGCTPWTAMEMQAPCLGHPQQRRTQSATVHTNSGPSQGMRLSNGASVCCSFLIFLVDWLIHELFRYKGFGYALTSWDEKEKNPSLGG